MAKDNTLLYYDSFYNREKDVMKLKMMNPDTGELSIVKVRKPKVPIYRLKAGVPVPQYYVETQNLENLDVAMVNYKWRPYEIAKFINNYHTFKSAVQQKKMKMNEIYLDRRCIGSDKSLEDLTIMQYLDSLGHTTTMQEIEVYPTRDNSFVEQFVRPQDKPEMKPIKKTVAVDEYDDVPPIRNLHKGFYDIETDIRNTDERCKQPITCSTYIDDKHRVAEVFAMKRSDFKGQKDIIDNPDKFIKDAKSAIIDMINASTLKGKAREKLLPKFIKFIEDMTVNIHWFNSEATMIRKSWKTMTQDYKPQFLGIYNAKYDIGQTEMRADELGIDKSKLFCHPDVGDQYIFNNTNESPKAKERRHDYLTESYTKIIDTQITYFGLRPQDGLESESLDSVAKFENGFGKQDYSHITDYIGHFPYLDFRTYLIYNIMDVAVMIFLEMKTADIESLLTKRFIVRSEYARVFSPMNNVTNTMYHVCRRQGYILSNGVNKFILSDDSRMRDADAVVSASYDLLKDRLSIPGGLCSDPNLYKRVSAPILPGLENLKYAKKLLDADAVSMYPKIIEHTNVAKDAVGGRVVNIKNAEGKKVCTPEEAVISLIMKSPFEIGNKFLGLPNPSDIMRMCDDDLPKLPDLSKKAKIVIPTVSVNTTNKKVSELLRKALSSLDNTKYDASDIKAGDYNTGKHFHIYNNDSIMKINGSKYVIKYIPNEGHPNMNEIFGIAPNTDAYLKYAKNVYSNAIDMYTKPKDYTYSEDDVIYNGRVDEDILYKLSNDKYNLISYIVNTIDGDKRIDMSARTHVLSSGVVNMKITNDDMFIFNYTIPCSKYGRLDVTIFSQTLQY